MRFNILLALVLGMGEARGRFIQKPDDSSTSGNSITPDPLPASFEMCWTNIPVGRRVRVLPQVDIAFLVLKGFRDLALAPFSDRRYLPSIKSSLAPDLEIPIEAYNGRQASIETQMYGMWYCWGNMLRDFAYAINTVVCNFGGSGPPEDSEAKLTYFSHGPDPGVGDGDGNDTQSIELQQGQSACSRSQMPIVTSRRDLEGLVTGESVKRASSPPINYGTWEQLAANETDIEENLKDESNRTPEYYARIGDFSSPRLEPMAAFRGMYLVLMHLAKMTSPEARTQSMRAQRIRFRYVNFVIEYHPRPGAVEQPSYKAVVKGIAYIGRVWKITDNPQTCSFVLFHGDNPIVDGKIELIEPSAQS